MSDTEEKELRWEAQRINAALGVDDPDIYKEAREGALKGALRRQLWICSVGSRGSVSTSLTLCTKGTFQVAFFHPDGFSEEWSIFNYQQVSPALFWLPPNHRHLDDVLRTLYCLGADTKAIAHYYNVDLTAHQKLELRLSTSREFWPKRWLEEEAQ